MKRCRLLAAGAVTGLAVTACGSVTQTGVPTPGAPRSTAAQPPASVASSIVWFDCTHHGQQEPSDYILTCADAGSVLEHLVWKSWTARQAVATGVHELNNCTPNCAEGRFIGYPVVVTLWRSEPVSGQPGQRCFTRITVRYTGPRPPAYTSNGRLVRHPAQWTEPLGPFGT